ncbi:MAG TPA: rhodanese-like domain-containing protein [Cryobacterium sp.]|nr:rhodanese-like domain-containing protein [Cryobacterium sp.]
MIVKQYYIGCLSQGSYLIGDETTGQAVVVDPRRDVTEYLVEAAALNLTITGVINTHFHADFVSGHLELAAATGAWIGYGQRAETEYAIRRFAHGDKISLGDVELEILETPGHTWESISVLVREHAGDAVPYAVLTGDALFIGDVGRPDLIAAPGASPAELGTALYNSIHQVLLALPDEVRVMPAHGAGSSCGKNLSDELESTIGAQRLTNPSVQPMTVDEFLEVVTTGQPAAPEYFATAVAQNKSNRPVMTRSPEPAAFTPGQLLAAVEDGARIIDSRSPEDFAAGHVRGSVNVGIDGRFAETAGMAVHAEDDIVLVADPGRENETALRLARIGFDRVVGFLASPADAFRGELAPLVRTGRRITADELERTAAAENAVIVDVRNPGERDQGFIPGTIHIPLAQIARRHRELDGAAALIIHCAGGWRSSVAASMLRERGYANVSDVTGGYNAWAAQQV